MNSCKLCNKNNKHQITGTLPAHSALQGQVIRRIRPGLAALKVVSSGLFQVHCKRAQPTQIFHYQLLGPVGKRPLNVCVCTENKKLRRCTSGEQGLRGCYCMHFYTVTEYNMEWAVDYLHTHTHTQLFNGPFSGTTQLGRYQKKRSPTHADPDHQTFFEKLPPPTTIHSIILIQFTCLTVIFHILSPGPLWS